MFADVESPVFLGCSEMRGEEAFLGFAERRTISPICGNNGFPDE
jgi:hypothetical protein